MPNVFDPLDPSHMIDRVFIIAVMRDGSKRGWEIPFSGDPDSEEQFFMDNDTEISYSLWDIQPGNAYQAAFGRFKTTFTVVTDNPYTEFSPEYFNPPTPQAPKEISNAPQNPEGHRSA